MSRTRVVIASLGAATAAVAMVSATSFPADAAKAKPYTVKVGTNTSGSFAATGATIGGTPQINFKDTTTGTNLTCNSGTANTTVKAGKNKTGKGIATIPSTGFNGCAGPLNLKFVVTQSGTWSLDAIGKVAAGADVPGQISNVKAHVASTPNASQCSFDVTGTVGGSFKQSSQQLAVGGAGTTSTLTVSNVVGCFNLVKNGDNTTFLGTYAITSPSGAISVVGG